jgi:hypothetical protein
MRVKNPCGVVGDWSKPIAYRRVNDQYLIKDWRPCPNPENPVIALPTKPYTLDYPLTVRWTAPEGDKRPLTYTVVMLLKGILGD